MNNSRHSTTAWDNFSTYLLVERKMSSSPKSVRALKSRFLKLHRYFEDKEFNRDNFNGLIKDCMSTYSISYINNLIKIAKHWDKYSKINCLQDYTFFKEHRHQTKDTLTFEEMAQLANCDMKYRINSEEINLRHKTMILVLSCTGMRIGELLNIGWTDLCLNGDIFAVTLRDTKNGEDRVNILTPQLWALIHKLPKKDKTIFGLKTEWGFKKDLKDRAVKCSIQKNIYPHLFRASFVTEMRKKGANYEQIAPITGHHDLNIMKDHYDQVALLDIEQTLFNFNSLFEAHQSFEMLKERIRKTLEKMVNPQRYALAYTETDHSVRFEVYIK